MIDETRVSLIRGSWLSNAFVTSMGNDTVAHLTIPIISRIAFQETDIVAEKLLASRGPLLPAGCLSY